MFWEYEVLTYNENKSLGNRTWFMAEGLIPRMLHRAPVLLLRSTIQQQWVEQEVFTNDGKTEHPLVTWFTSVALRIIK